MLSIDQFIRLICVPVIVAAFVIASQFSGTLNPRPTAVEMARR
jgi:hypothetical protein